MFDRSATLTVIAVLAGALLTAAPATAAGETCQGKPATIIGTGAEIQGTEGDDVIVTGSSVVAHANGGNDLVCVTPSAEDEIRVYAGAGDDVVDASASTVRRTAVELGVGVDRYLGSPGINDLTADGTDDTVDSTGAVNGVTLLITGPAGSVTGTYRGSGADFDFFSARSVDRAVEVELDGQVSVDGVPAADVTGFRNALVQAPDVALRGNGDDNNLTARGCDLHVGGASGDDDIVINTYVGEETLAFDCETTSRLTGGPGDDTISGRDGQDRLVGNGGDDVLRGGADADVLVGGGGNDKLVGGAGHDVLIGNRGRDRANGQQDRDRCVAERERRCER